MYFMGSSEGGRVRLVMAQRYPADFDAIFALVPVINWVGLQHAGTWVGPAQMGPGWISPAKIRLIHDAMLAARDAAEGLAGGIISDHEGCRKRFVAARLFCARGADAGPGGLSAAQLRAVPTLLTLSFRLRLANGVRSCPGWPSNRGSGDPNQATSFDCSGGR